MGVFFSAGWSPCVGPILGAILTFSMYGGSVPQGILMLTAYSAGLAIPFLVAAAEISLATQLIRRYRNTTRYIEKGMGVILILVGLLLFSGRFQQISSLGTFFGTFDELALGRLLLIILAGLIVLGIIPAIIAHRKGRSFLDWWLFGTFLFPVALIMALRIKPGTANDPLPAQAAISNPEEKQPFSGA
jgi:cytochrome c-type biogenesis protein